MLFDGRYMTSYLMAIVMFAISFIIYEIFTNQIKCQKFELENKLRTRIKTEVAPFEWECLISFKILTTQSHVYEKCYAYTHIQ